MPCPNRYDFDSWREFSYLDEENLESAQRSDICLKLIAGICALITVFSPGILCTLALQAFGRGLAFDVEVGMGKVQNL